MYAFLWKDLKEISDRYHSGGSIIIISYTIESARKTEHKSAEDDMNWLLAPCCIKEIQLKEPDEIFYAPQNTQVKVYHFLDAGCC